MKNLLRSLAFAFLVTLAALPASAKPAPKAPVCEYTMSQIMKMATTEGYVFTKLTPAEFKDLLVLFGGPEAVNGAFDEAYVAEAQANSETEDVLVLAKHGCYYGAIEIDHDLALALVGRSA